MPGGGLPDARGTGLARDLMSWAETFLAPLGVITAVLVFFGWTRSRAYFSYFGVDQQLLQYSVQDHVLSSADPAFGALVRGIVLVAAVAIAQRALGRWTDPSRDDRLARRVRAAVIGTGVLLLAFGLGFAGGLPLAEVIPAMWGALSLAAGVVILLRTYYAGPAGSPPREGRGLVVLGLLVAIFWATALLAQDTGRALARDVDDHPARLASATIFSDTYLDFPGTMVTPTITKAPDGTPRHRYSGLRVLAYANGRWFLLSNDYGGVLHPTVTVLTDSDKIRVELTRQDQGDGG